MWNFSKKISLYAGILTGFVITLQAFQGTFKTFWPGKLVRISKSSQTFLTQIMPLQQDLFAGIIFPGSGIAHQDQEYMLALLQLSRSWIHSDSMRGSDIDRFGQLLSGFKQIEIQKKNIASNKNAIKISINLIKSIAQILAKEIRQVRIGTAQVDLQYIELFLQQLQEHPWDISQKVKALQVFGIALDIIHHFDGVSVTEYDFIVLSQCVLFVQLLMFMN